MSVILNRRILVVERKHTRSWNERRMKELARVDLYFRFFRTRSSRRLVPFAFAGVSSRRRIGPVFVCFGSGFLTGDPSSREMPRRRVIVALDDE